MERLISKNCSFSYNNKNVLDNLNLLIPAGKKVAISRSCLVQENQQLLICLLLNFFTNYRGKIFIDDQDINDCTH